jgi:hypothetical protein
MCQGIHNCHLIPGHVYFFSLEKIILNCFSKYRVCIFSSLLSFSLPFPFCAGICLVYVRTKMLYTTYMLPLRLLKIWSVVSWKFGKYGVFLTVCNWNFCLDSEKLLSNHVFSMLKHRVEVTFQSLMCQCSSVRHRLRSWDQCMAQVLQIAFTLCHATTYMSKSWGLTLNYRTCIVQFFVCPGIVLVSLFLARLFNL